MSHVFQPEQLDELYEFRIAPRFYTGGIGDYAYTAKPLRVTPFIPDDWRHEDELYRRFRIEPHRPVYQPPHPSWVPAIRTDHTLPGKFFPQAEEDDFYSPFGTPLPRVAYEEEEFWRGSPLLDRKLLSEEEYYRPTPRLHQRFHWYPLSSRPSLPAIGPGPYKEPSLDSKGETIILDWSSLADTKVSPLPATRGFILDRWEPVSSVWRPVANLPASEFHYELNYPSSVESRSTLAPIPQYYQLRVLGDHGDGYVLPIDEPVVFKYRPTAPLAPTGLSVDEHVMAEYRGPVLRDSPRSVHLSWVPPLDQGGEPISRYEVEYTTVPSSQTSLPHRLLSWRPLGPVSDSHTSTPSKIIPLDSLLSSVAVADSLPELEHDLNYRFRVRAVNRFGTSEWAESPALYIGDKFRPPAVVGELTTRVTLPEASDKREPTVTLSWLPLPTNRVSGYLLEYALTTLPSHKHTHRLYPHDEALAWAPLIRLPAEASRYSFDLSQAPPHLAYDIKKTQKDVYLTQPSVGVHFRITPYHLEWTAPPTRTLIPLEASRFLPELEDFMPTIRSYGATSRVPALSKINIENVFHRKGYVVSWPEYQFSPREVDLPATSYVLEGFDRKHKDWRSIVETAERSIFLPYASISEQPLLLRLRCRSPRGQLSDVLLTSTEPLYSPAAHQKSQAPLSSVRGLRTLYSTPHSVLLTWNTPLSQKREELDLSYIVEMKEGPLTDVKEPWQPLAELPQSETLFNVSISPQNKGYHFRVITVDSRGNRSEPALLSWHDTASTPVIAKRIDFQDEFQPSTFRHIPMPGPILIEQKRLQLDKYLGDSVESKPSIRLSWAPIRFDKKEDGKDIHGEDNVYYIVEYRTDREAASSWLPVHSAPISETSIELRDLPEGLHYYFRVSATTDSKAYRYESSLHYRCPTSLPRYSDSFYLGEQRKEEPPRFRQVMPAIVEARYGSSAKFLVQFDSIDDDTTVTWYHKGRPIYPGVRRSHVSGKESRVEVGEGYSQLILTRVSEADCGSVECFLTNKLATVTAKSTLDVKEAPVVVPSALAVEGAVPQSLVAAANRTHWWSLSQQEKLQYRDKVSPRRSRSPTRDDRLWPVSSTSQATVPSSASSILQHQATLGETTELRFVVRGWPRPRLLLSKDNIPFSSAATNVSIVIQEPLSAATTPISTLATTATSALRKQLPPVSSSASQRADAGPASRLKRLSTPSISTKPVGPITCTLTDYELSKEEQRLPQVMREAVVVVRLANVTKQDVGRYTLRASNDLGAWETSVDLKIEDKVVAPPKWPLVTRHNNDCYLIEWMSSPDTSLTGYIVEYRWPSISRSTWRELDRIRSLATTYWCRLLTDGISPFEDGATGMLPEQPEFRIRAYNEFGVSEPSKAVSAIGGYGVQAATRQDSLDLYADNTFYRNVRNLYLPKQFTDRFDICQSLGENNYIQLYRLLDTESGRYWLGRLALFNDYSGGASVGTWRKSWFEHEANLRSALSHSSLLRMKEHYTDERRIMQVLQMVKGRLLYDELDRKMCYLEDQIVEIARQICELLRHLHSRSFAHFGIEPHNVLLQEAVDYLSNDEDMSRSQVKFVDVGQSQRLPLRSQHLPDAQTSQFYSPGSVHLLYRQPQYIPPEALVSSISDRNIGTPADMWSLGMLLYRLSTGTLPWKDRSRAQLEEIYRREPWSPELHFLFNERNMSPEFQDFTRSLLQRDPAQRLTAYQALSHPWLRMERAAMQEAICDSPFLSSGVVGDNQMLGLRHRLLNWPLQVEDAWTRGDTPIDYTADSELPLTIVKAKLIPRADVAPKIISGLINLNNVAEGASANFMLRFFDISDLGSIEWFFNNRCLLKMSSPSEASRRSQRYSCSCNVADNSITFTIDSVNLLDSGTYSVVVSNKDGTLQTMDSAMLRVKQSEEPRRRSLATTESTDLGARVVAPLIDTTGFVGENITIKALVTGIPQPQISWEFSGSPLENSAKIRIHHDSDEGWASLQVRRLTTKDAGLYKLRVKNRHGGDESSMHLLVVDTSSEEYKRVPQFITPTLSENKRLLEGNSFELACKAAASKADEPAPKIRWLFNRRPLLHTTMEELGLQCEDSTIDEPDRQRKVRRSRLTSTSARPIHKGLYTCVASSSAGSTHCETLVSVQSIGSSRRSVDRIMPMATVRAPEFIQRPKPKQLDLYDHIGQRRHAEDLVITCAVLGSPTPEVVWSKDGKPISSAGALASKYSIKNLGGHFYELRVHQPNEEDVGIYETLAFNKGGECRCQCVVTLRDDIDFHMPKFIRQLRISHVREGHPLELTCCATGKPMPKFHWEKDCLDILTDSSVEPHFEIEDSNKGESTLRVHRVSRQDEGLYQCTAINQYGRVKCCAFVRVERTGDYTGDKRGVSMSPSPQLPRKSSIQSSYTKTMSSSRTATSRFERAYSYTPSDLPPIGLPPMQQKSTKMDFSSPSLTELDKFGSASTPSDATVSVLQKPPKIVQVTEGETLTLTFIIKCPSYYRSTWTKRGRHLRYDNKHRITRDLETGQHQLCIDECTSVDAGKYTLEIDCEALLGADYNPLVLPVSVEVNLPVGGSKSTFSQTRKYSAGSIKESITTTMSTTTTTGFTSYRRSLSRSSTPASYK